MSLRKKRIDNYDYGLRRGLENQRLLIISGNSTARIHNLITRDFSWLDESNNHLDANKLSALHHCKAYPIWERMRLRKGTFYFVWTIREYTGYMIREDVNMGYGHMNTFTWCYMKCISSQGLEKPWLEAFVKILELAFCQKRVFDNLDTCIERSTFLG